MNADERRFMQNELNLRLKKEGGERVMGEKIDKEALKKLREERKVSVERARKTIKTHNGFIKKIKEQMNTEAKTVPEIAQATEILPSQVLWYISTMRKYGLVSEGEKDGDYFKYQLVS